MTNSEEQFAAAEAVRCFVSQTEEHSGLLRSSIEMVAGDATREEKNKRASQLQMLAHDLVHNRPEGSQPDWLLVMVVTTLEHAVRCSRDGRDVDERRAAQCADAAVLWAVHPDCHQGVTPIGCVSVVPVATTAAEANEYATRHMEGCGIFLP